VQPHHGAEERKGIHKKKKNRTSESPLYRKKGKENALAAIHFLDSPAKNQKREEGKSNSGLRAQRREEAKFEKQKNKKREIKIPSKLQRREGEQIVGLSFKFISLNQLLLREPSRI